MVLAVDVSTALLGGSQPTSVAWHWGYSTQPDAVPLRRCIAFDHGLGLRSIWSRGSSDRSRSRAHFTERPGMPGFFSKASLSDFPIFPMSADFFGETGRLDFFFLANPRIDSQKVHPRELGPRMSAGCPGRKAWIMSEGGTTRTWLGGDEILRARHVIMWSGWRVRTPATIPARNGP